MRMWIALVVFAGCRASVPVAAPATAPPRAPARATLTGTVRDTTGQPLAGARIVAARAGRTRTAVSDEAGRYVLTDLAAGDYEVTYSSDGSEEQSSLHLAGTSQYDVALSKSVRRMTVYAIGKRCKDLHRLGRLRIICYRSLVDRAMHEVDQSPRQLQR